MQEAFMINQLIIKLKSMMILKNLQQDKQMVMLQNICLDYQYFKNHYQLIADDLSKQKALDAGSIAIQQIDFYEMLKTNSRVCTVLEKPKETVLELYMGTAKVMWII